RDDPARAEQQECRLQRGKRALRLGDDGLVGIARGQIAEVEHHRRDRSAPIRRNGFSHRCMAPLQQGYGRQRVRRFLPGQPQALSGKHQRRRLDVEAVYPAARPGRFGEEQGVGTGAHGGVDRPSAGSEPLSG
ncbi:hypothetical protein KC345_g11577, partial [Hortaea werneckii]